MWLVRTKIRALHYSYQTEKTYVQWIKRFIHFVTSNN
ncbi:phage integrase N-terminal SAM-like domain-containing protein [Aliikangiella sp. IMCC44653]